MKNNKPVETEPELLRALEELLTDVSENDPIEDIHEELSAYGFNPSILGKQIESIAKRALADSSLNWKNTARLEIESARSRMKRMETGESTPSLDRAFLISKIQTIYEKIGNRGDQLLPVYHRNFESASDQDLLSILHDLEFLASDPDEPKD